MPTLPVDKPAQDKGQPGLPIDIYGGQTVDPTKNVLDLVAQQVKRLDDIADLRAKHTAEIADIRDKHYKELAIKEASRVDSIRQVDQSNQISAAKAALDAIQTLATTASSTAAANAKQVTDLATSVAASQASIVDALSKRIAALELSSAEGIGKTRVIDPQIDTLIKTVDNLAGTQSVNQGKSTQSSAIIAWIFGGIGAAVSIILLFLRLNGQ